MPVNRRHALVAGLLLTLSACAAPNYGHSPAKPDADMQAVLDTQAGLGVQPIEQLDPATARQQPSFADAARALLEAQDKNPDDSMGVATRDTTYTGAAGKLPMRIYTPKNPAGKNRKGKALPIVLYFHGGGFVLADLDTYDATPRAIAAKGKMIVVSAEYRHAPENRFPAAHDDAFAAYQWVLANARRLGGDPRRVAVMGESAGANLAINTSIAARDNGVQMPMHQVLIYPLAGVNMDTISYRENAYARPLNKAMVEWFMGHYLNGEQDKQDPRIDLVGKADVSGLPGTTVVLAEIDPLRSEGGMLAKKLEDARVLVRQRNYKGSTHEFFGLGRVVKDANDAEQFVANELGLVLR